jgi:hypothetical protein
MKNTAAYFCITGFCAVAFMWFVWASVNAFNLGHIKATAVQCVLATLAAWGGWTAFNALREVRKKYVIAAGYLSGGSGAHTINLALENVTQVAADAHTGYLTLFGASSREILRIHIDNPIVPQLKAYLQNAKLG